MLNLNFIQDPSSSELKSNVLNGTKPLITEKYYSFTNPQDFKVYLNQDFLNFDNSSLKLTYSDDSEIPEGYVKIGGEEKTSNLSYIGFSQGPVFTEDYFAPGYGAETDKGSELIEEEWLTSKNKLFSKFKVLSSLDKKYDNLKIISAYSGDIVATDSNENTNLSSIRFFSLISLFYSDFILNLYFYKGGAIFVTGTKIGNNNKDYKEFIETVVEFIKNLEI